MNIKPLYTNNSREVFLWKKKLKLKREVASKV